jgi:hypothetical protein
MNKAGVGAGGVMRPPGSGDESGTTLEPTSTDRQSKYIVLIRTSREDGDMLWEVEG